MYIKERAIYLREEIDKTDDYIKEMESSKVDIEKEIIKSKEEYLNLLTELEEINGNTN